MKTIAIKYFFILFVFLLLQIGNAFAVVEPVTKTKTIRVIENKGQWESNVLFKANIPGGFLFITKQGLAYAMYDEGALHEKDHNHKNGTTVNGHNLFVDFVGSNSTSTVIKQNKSAEYYNYFIGNDKSKWANFCYAYEKVTLQNIYNNIDLELISLDGAFKMNFIVHANGNPNTIKLKYRGANALNIYNGALEITTSLGMIKEEKPLCLQGEVTIPSQFILTDNTLSYQLSSYNKNQDLLIDPTVVFATFSGSYADNWGFTATYDNNGNAYSGGTVYAIGFPVTVGAFQLIYRDGFSSPTNLEDIARDAGILKYSADGTHLLYATLLGGIGNEQPHSMICDSSGNLIVMGTTTSTNFPISSGAYDGTQNGKYDIFIVKLSADGSTLLGSTYFGGAKDDGINSDSTHEFYDAINRPLTFNYGDQFRGEVMIDGNGSNYSIYVASTTASTTDNGFPIQNGFQTSYGGGIQDGCLLKFNSALTSLSFSTYIGGNNADAAFGITIDYLGNAIICGGTKSSNINSTGGSAFAYHGGTDGFIAKISPYGNSLQAFIYIGTTLFDQTYFLQTDNQQNIYVAGQTFGNMPVSSGVYSNTGGKQFILILDKNLTSIKTSTIFGTSSLYPNISPSAFLVDVCGRVYVSGWGGVINNAYNSQTGSTYGLPITANAVQKTTDGSDFYLIVFSKNLTSLAYATFYGGNVSLEHVDGGTSRFDKNGNVFQAVCGGCGGHSDFPTTNGAWSNTNNSTTPYKNCNNAIFKINLNVSEFAPVFADTLIKITATDLLSFPFQMTDKDGDSIFYTFTGSVFNLSGNPATVIKKEGAGKSTGILNWQTQCKDASSTDTLEITINMTDNGCPTIRTGIGKIKIIVMPPPIIPAPYPQCLKTINDNTLKLQWQKNSSSKYFKAYKIYRKKEGENFNLLATVNTINTVSFIDTSAILNVINNYCYFISTINICDSIGDTSRTVCSLFKNDTSTTPAFIFSKDSIVNVYAMDTLNLTTYIYSVDDKDSVFIQCDGNIFSNSKLVSFSTKNDLSKATITLRWIASCNGIDTPYLRFYVKNNQCPSPQTNSGLIRIVTIPPPQNSPPNLSCVKYIDNNDVEIKWEQSNVNKFFKKFILLKKSPDGSIKTFVDVLNSNSFLTEDNSAIGNLKNNYCYAITSQDICGNYGDTSDFKCSVKQPSDYPFQIPFYTVTVNDNKNVAVFWRKSFDNEFSLYTLYKQDLKTQDYIKIYQGTHLSDTFLLDQNVKVQQYSYCYKITQNNNCGLESLITGDACSILLKGVSNPFEHTLKWNAYNYWYAGVKYYDIVRIQPDNNPEYILQSIATQSIDDKLNYNNGLYQYKIIANEGVKGYGLTSTSNTIELIQKPLLHVPNAFTANGDGLNDTWGGVPIFVKEYNLKIYDRWGKLVFETNNKHQQWNGIAQDGSDAICDVYVYVITYSGWDDSSHLVKGNFTILK